MTISEHNKRVIKDFQDWVADANRDNLGTLDSPDAWLEGYLDMLGDIIAGSGIPLEEIVEQAKQGTFDPRIHG